jgi:LPPG:FO 2-phospho-L-lactate transferase
MRVSEEESNKEKKQITNKIVFLSGGTGTPKLLLGMRELLSDDEIVVIANNGDDEVFFGLLVCPDLDTVLYLFSNQLDLEQFWGVKNDSFQTLKQLQLLDAETWFQLGDKDLALHLLRNQLLHEGYTLTKTTEEIIRRLEITATILPMTNQKIRTTMTSTKGKELTFQEYTVKYREEPEIKAVNYKGAEKASISKEALKAIKTAKAVIIGPSNPITSIGPILSIKNLKKALEETSAPVIAISPIRNGKAFSGPTVKLMKQLGMEGTTLALASLYQSFIDYLVLSSEDEVYKGKINSMGIKTITNNISLKNTKERVQLAEELLQIIKGENKN